MTNCTIPTKFFAEVLKLDSQSQIYVLTTCRQLADSDDDTIEQFQLPEDAPDVLVDFVKRLKRRVGNARRRRERLAARPKVGMNPDSSSQTTSVAKSDREKSEVEQPRSVNHAVKMLEVASAYVLEMGDVIDMRRLKYICRLVSNVSETLRNDLYILRKNADRLARHHRSYSVA